MPAQTTEPPSASGVLASVRGWLPGRPELPGRKTVQRPRSRRASPWGVAAQRAVPVPEGASSRDTIQLCGSGELAVVRLVQPPWAKRWRPSTEPIQKAGVPSSSRVLSAERATVGSAGEIENGSQPFGVSRTMPPTVPIQ